MLDQTQSLPGDPSELRSVAVQLAATVKSQALHIAKLEHQLAGHRRHRFGARSETKDQLELKLEEEEIAAAKIAPTVSDDTGAAPKNKPKRKPLPDSLPRNEEVLSPGDACGTCGGTLKTLGEDITEELEYVPWPVRGEPLCPAPDGLRLLRGDLPGALAIAPDRTRSPRPGPAGACVGQ